MTKRFTYEEIVFKTVTDDDGKEIKFWSPTIKDNGKVIYDGKESDDVKNICALLNKQEGQITYLNRKLKEYEILAEQLNLQTGSIAYLKMISLDYSNTVLHIEKDKEEDGVVKIYVKKDYNEPLLKAFMKNIPLGVKYKIIAVTDVKTEIIKEGFQLD